MGQQSRSSRSAFATGRQAALLAAAILVAAPSAALVASASEVPTPPEPRSASESAIDPEQSAARVLLWIRRIHEEDQRPE